MARHVKVNVSAVEISLKNLEKGFDAKSLMDEIGHFLQLKILDRTSKGIGVSGQSFKPYTTSYKRVREEEGLPTAHADLFFGGSMLNSMTYESTKDSVRLFFMNTPHTEKKKSKSRKTGRSFGLTNAELAYYSNESREFFAISMKEEKMIMDMVEQYFDHLIQME